MPRGGPGIPKSEEGRKNMAEAQRASWTPERRAKASALYAERRWNDGRKQNLSPEKREEKARNFRENNPMKNGMSDEQRQLLSRIKTGTSPRLKAYGITPEQYKEELSRGNLWCCAGKHFVPESEINSSGVCRPCAPEFFRKCDLKKKYGVTHEWYLAKLEEQGGGCGICGIKTPNSDNKHFAVDHNHKTGAARGLLCSRCNTALSIVEDRPELVAVMVAYLERYR